MDGHAPCPHVDGCRSWIMHLQLHRAAHAAQPARQATLLVMLVTQVLRAATQPSDTHAACSTQQQHTHHTRLARTTIILHCVCDYFERLQCHTVVRTAYREQTDRTPYPYTAVYNKQGPYLYPTPADKAKP